MAVKLRLTRMGAKKRPSYRIVASIPEVDGLPAQYINHLCSPADKCGFQRQCSQRVPTCAAHLAIQSG